jgi:ligand-binding SRPBCC domain-containing protein
MRYEHRFTVKAPLTAVAEFHNDTSALRRLSPPPMIVQFNDVEPLAEGSVADFTMWLGPVPIRWVAVHSEVSSAGFVDTQQKGPFKAWRHQHQFHALDEHTTEVIDTIDAEYGNLISRFMWLNLPVLFAYRGWRTRQTLEK